MPASAADPVLGSAPTVQYRAPGLGSNADVSNPKTLNAELPADVDRSTGVDGVNVFTRARRWPISEWRRNPGRPTLTTSGP